MVRKIGRVANQAFSELGDRDVSRAPLSDDRSHFAMDLVQLFQADAVQLLRRQVGGGVLPRQVRVDRGAVGDRPDARLAARMTTQVVLEEREHLFE